MDEYVLEMQADRDTQMAIAVAKEVGRLFHADIDDVDDRHAAREARIEDTLRGYEEERYW